MRLEVHSEAREEFLHAVSFYDAQVPGLGLRFITEIDRCQIALLETPLIGYPYGRRLRKFTVGDKFPYSIVYAGSRGCFICIGVRSWLAATRLLADAVHPLTIGSSDSGARLRWAKEGVDDWDKSASLVGNALPRRSASSLDDRIMTLPHIHIHQEFII
jgi:hypothetical protein